MIMYYYRFLNSCTLYYYFVVTCRDFLVKDREGISITADKADYINGTYHLQIRENVESTVFLRIENETQEVVELCHCEMLKRMRVFRLDDVKKVTEGQGGVHLIPGRYWRSGGGGQIIFW